MFFLRLGPSYFWGPLGQFSGFYLCPNPRTEVLGTLGTKGGPIGCVYVTLPETNSIFRTWKWMVGRRSFEIFDAGRVVSAFDCWRSKVVHLEWYFNWRLLQKTADLTSGNVVKQKVLQQTLDSDSNKKLPAPFTQKNHATNMQFSKKGFPNQPCQFVT